MPDVTRRSTIACPECGVETETTMSVDRCQFFWACPTCDETLRPDAGDCCVFCTYGSMPCPPVQRDQGASCGDGT